MKGICGGAGKMGKRKGERGKGKDILRRSTNNEGSSCGSDVNKLTVLASWRLGISAYAL